MAYQTGVATTLDDLVQTMLAFAVANGFTLGPSWTISTGSGVSLTNYQLRSLEKNGVYYIFQYGLGGGANADLGKLYATTATGTLNTAGVSGQPGAPAYNGRFDSLAGPFVGYHMFSDGLGFNMAVEVVTNVFVHVNFGELQKNGAYAGGQYMGCHALTSRDGSTGFPLPLFDDRNILPMETFTIGNVGTNRGNVANQVRTPVGSAVSALARGASATIAYATGWASNFGRLLMDCSPNTSNGRAVLAPIHVVVASNSGTGPYYQLGYIGNARMVNIKNLNPKETVNTDWMVFPVQQKNGPGTTYLNSLNYGMAYRK